MRERVRVLLVASARPPKEKLSAIVGRLHDLDAEVRLVLYQDLPAHFDDVPLDGVHSLKPAAEGRGPEFRRAVRGADAEKNLWLHLKHDDWVVEHTYNATVIVALDQRSTTAVRKLARLSPHATALPDIEQAVRRLQQPPDSAAAVEGATPARARDIIDLLPARAVLAWPYLSERRRFEIAGRTAIGLLGSGHPDQAERTVRRALKRIESPRLRADLLGDLVNATLADGHEPGLTVEAYAAELAVADWHYANNRHRAAAESFVEATHVAFHRVLHFDRTTSPLAVDPARYTAPLRDSTTAQALRAPRGRALPAATGEGTGADQPTSPTRVLVATRTNDNFLREIRDHLDSHPDLDSRFVDFADAKDLTRYARDPALIAEQILGRQRDLAERVETHLRSHLDWADVVFVEWCTALAAMVTLIDPKDTRIIVRLHSYEAFTHWPHLVEFSRVDDVLFVSDHLRDLAVAAIPALREPHAPRLHVLPLGMRLQQYARPKPDDARFTLGLVGWGSVAKDPRWAFEVLRKLRKHDDRYRLLLVGAEFADDASAATQAYASQMREDLAELEPSGAVLRVRHTDDVASALTEVGVILSTSVRESFHAGLVEGAASGAVPVVRDWPFFAGRPNSARTLFPNEWVVGSPEEAVERILRTTASDGVWRAVGGAAAEHGLGHWDWDVVSHDYDRLLSR